MEAFLITTGTVITFFTCLSLSSYVAYRKLEAEYRQPRQILFDIGVSEWIKKNKLISIQFWRFREDPMHPQYLYVTPLYSLGAEKDAGAGIGSISGIFTIRNSDLKVISSRKPSPIPLKHALAWLQKLHQPQSHQSQQQHNEFDALEAYNIQYLRRFVFIAPKEERNVKSFN